VALISFANLAAIGGGGIFANVRVPIWAEGHSAKMSLWDKNQVKLLWNSHFLRGVPAERRIIIQIST
jgi:hypothetical protein